MNKSFKIAVVGAGVSGLVSARALSRVAEVSLFEAQEQLGGHANTVDVSLDGITHGVDTGFLVYNERTYPGLIELFAELGIPLTPSRMGFSVQVSGGFDCSNLEWCGNSLNSVFADRRNLFKASFWGMLADIIRFNRIAQKILLKTPGSKQTLGELISLHKFSSAFVDHYFLPMVACIWSCEPKQMLEYPLISLLRFCQNHGLLQIFNRPQWFTVAGGSRQYVLRMIKDIDRIHLATPVCALTRPANGKAGILLHATKNNLLFSELFDAVIFATHSDQTLAILGNNALDNERQCLSAISYQENLAVLHTDERVMPKHKLAWAAWNFEKTVNSNQNNQDSKKVCLHYWINDLQPLPFKKPVIVSLNPIRPIAAEKILQTFQYSHPIFDQQAIHAQTMLQALDDQAENSTHTWFAGAWTKYGFHEDGLQSGLRAAKSVMQAFNLTDLQL